MGEAVKLVITVVNEGGSCTGTEGSGPCSDGATASNASGTVVWLSNPGPYGCPALLLRTIPPGWHDSDQISWDQGQCPGNSSQCTHAQVPAGRYTLIGYWSAAGAPTRSGPVTIDVTP